MLDWSFTKKYWWLAVIIALTIYGCDSAREAAMAQSSTIEPSVSIQVVDGHRLEPVFVKAQDAPAYSTTDGAKNHVFVDPATGMVYY